MPNGAFLHVRRKKKNIRITGTVFFFPLTAHHISVYIARDLQRCIFLRYILSSNFPR